MLRVLLASALAAAQLSGTAAADAAVADAAVAGSGRGASVRASEPAARSARAQRVAPSAPPLVGASGAEAATGAAQGGGEPAREGLPQPDPLVQNGLGSPTCAGTAALGGLPERGRAHCESSGFAAAAAPTGDYGIDVHIDTGVLGLSSGGLLTAVQDIVIQPLWMAQVWCVHALVVMLEWAFTLDLLDGALGSGIGSTLAHLQGATGPWLALALSVAAVLAAWEGLVRRRVGDALGNALVMFAMMAAAGWLVTDPQGTIGVLSAWSDQAALGTLGAASGARGAGALSAGMEGVYAGAIEAPWCYLEFGDVDWCTNARRVEPALRRAAAGVVAREQARIGCTPQPQAGGEPAGDCAQRGTAGARALERSAELLRSAGTNGAFFLALPANGAARNSINDSWSLLRAICGGDEATRCSGPAAAQAQFRTDVGTWPRLGGLLLIGGGLLGMLLLLGFIAVRLLTASAFSIVFLLAAPAVMLAPAFGEAGRAIFRRWSVLLLSAVAAKLIFAFVLGVVLAVAAAIRSLPAIGWWAQWLLISAFWWSLFLRRGQLLAGPSSIIGQSRMRRPRSRAGDLASGGATGAVKRARERLAGGDPSGGEQAPRGGAAASAGGPGGGRAPGGAGTAAKGLATDRQAERVLAADRTRAAALGRRAPALRAALDANRARLAILQRERARAAAAGERRREVSLAARAERVRASVGRDRLLLDGGGSAARGTPAEQAGAVAAMLDRQAKLPPARSAADARGRRDYRRLAPLVGVDGEAYAELDPAEARRTRLQIDRALAARTEAGRLTRAGAPDDPPAAAVTGSPRPREGSEPGASGALSARPRPGAPFPARRGGAGEDAEQRGGDAGAGRLGPQRGRERGAPAAAPAGHPESEVLRDIREWQAGRKRQLGIGNP